MKAITIWGAASAAVPLAVIAAGLGLSNGPASSASTSAVSPEQVGQASGISNMARYIGGSLFVAAIATVYNSVTVDHEKSGASAGDALAAALSRSCLVMAILSGLGIAVALLMARHHQRRPRAVDLAAAAAASSHTIPTEPLKA
jgi:predicted permease